MKDKEIKAALDAMEDAARSCPYAEYANSSTQLSLSFKDLDKARKNLERIIMKRIK